MVRNRLAFVSTLSLLLAAGPTTAPAPSPLLAEARRILAGVKQTEYSHPTHVDESAGTYRCDCSGLLDYCLKRVSPDLYARLPHNPGKRPLAVHFYEAFTSAPAADTPNPARPFFRRVTSLADARPGDIIAWCRTDRKPGEDTGHVVLLDVPPEPDGPNVYRVTVIDATSSPHADDTRPSGTSGVGRGTFWLQTDPEGRPTGYRWKSPGVNFTQRPIAIGRPITPP